MSGKTENLEKLADLISSLPDGKLKAAFTQTYTRLELADMAARNVEVKLIRNNWKVADALERQAKTITSSARDVKILKAVIREAIAQLRN